MSELHVEIVTPEALLFSREVHMITMPGASGEFGVLFGHVPLVSSINPGSVIIHNQEMKIIEHFFVSYGFVEVKSSSVILLVEKAISLSDVALDSFKEQLEILKKSLKDVRKVEEITIINRNISFIEGAIVALEKKA